MTTRTIALALAALGCAAFFGCVTLPAAAPPAASANAACAVDATKFCEAALNRGAASAAANVTYEDVTLQIPAGSTVKARCYIDRGTGLVVSGRNMPGPALSSGDDAYLRKRGICAGE